MKAGVVLPFEFEGAFSRRWHRGPAVPSPILIDWVRAYDDLERYGCTGEDAACRQLWDLMREAAYLMPPRLRTFWKSQGPPWPR